MAQRSSPTFAKRQREMEQKRRAVEKRQKRNERKEAKDRGEGGQEPDQICRPFTEEY
jgi:hypothetical protein